KRKPWEKNKPQKKKGGARKKNQKQTIKKVGGISQNPAPICVEGEDKKENKPDKEEDDEEDDASLSSSGLPPKFDEEESDVDDEWTDSSPKKVTFDAKSHKTHLVHSPYFPSEKYEWWWLVLTMLDKKQRRLVCPTVSCKTLVDKQTVSFLSDL
ncbi:unnamed protein product, partial [Strongylus vulgaris]